VYAATLHRFLKYFSEIIYQRKFVAAIPDVSPRLLYGSLVDPIVESFKHVLSDSFGKNWAKSRFPGLVS